jgi:hypothetical protein
MNSEQIILPMHFRGADLGKEASKIIPPHPDTPQAKKLERG